MKTIIELFEESVNQFSDLNYQYEKLGDKYVGYTYAQIKEKVYQFAAGLMAMGVKKGDRLALLAEGRPDWVVSELGILYTGAVNIPLSVMLNEKHDLQFRLDHSSAKMIVVSGRQVQKVRELIDVCKDLEQVIVLDKPESLGKKEIYFEDVLEKGKVFLETQKAQFDQTWKAILDNDYANICYTSGTTADPKGIILTHRNYTANVEQSMSIIKIPPHYTTLLILPWDHAFAHTAGVYTLMKLGASMAAIQAGKSPMETRRNISINIKDVKPHFLMSVPALAKNFRKNIEKGIREKGKTIERLYFFGLKVAYAYNGNGFNKGKGLKALLKPLVSLFDAIIFKKVREGFGGRLKFFIGGGALLDIELQQYFYALGMPMFQGYGLTEAAPVISANTPDVHKMGSSGILVKNLELKICDEDGNALPVGGKGEIVVKGENVMAGYWDNEEATKESIKDGWLFTGDLGYMDNDGFLYVMGRFKSLLIGDDGEKFSPEGIEEAFCEHSDVFEQCMLFNNQNPYTTCLLFPNIDAIKRKLKAHHHHIDFSSDAAVVEVLKLIEHELKLYRTGNHFGHMFPQRWLPTSVTILSKGFTQENLQLNTTLKMVRGKIVDAYQVDIDAMYTPKGKNLFRERNKEAVRALFNG